MQLNILSRSLSVEVSKFLSRFHFSGREKDGSKQAFSKARQNIKWEGFVALNDAFIQSFYGDQDYLHYKDKYLVLATDGTTYELPYERALLEEFNEFHNGQGHPICMAQSVKIYDVLNQLNVTSIFSPYNAGESKGYSEQVLFEKSLKKIPQLIDNKEHKVLLLGDKYYPSYYYFYELPRLGYDFIFRCKPSFSKDVTAFIQSSEWDSWLEIDLTRSLRKYVTSAKRIANCPDTIKVRCVKIALPNGTDSYLLTNVTEEDLSLKDLEQLYKLRWEEETSFDTDKNKIEVENFSSKTPNGIRQDFHARILTENLAQLLISEAQELLDQEQAGKNNKHKYKINRAVAIGLIKGELPKLFTKKQDVALWSSRLLKKILRRREIVRPNRAAPRVRKHKLKYPMNRRRVT